MSSSCPRCGWAIGEADHPCHICWEGRATSEDIPRLVELSLLGGRFFASGLLASVVDPAAAPGLRVACEHPDLDVRVKATMSLGFSGGPQDIPYFVGLLESPEPGLRQVARSALAEIGGPEAAEVLAATLDTVSGVEREQVLLALAWLRDSRVAEEVHERALAEVDHRDGDRRDRWPTFIWAHLHLAGRPARDELAARLRQRFASSPDPVAYAPPSPELQAATEAHMQAMQDAWKGKEDVVAQERVEETRRRLDELKPDPRPAMLRYELQQLVLDLQQAVRREQIGTEVELDELIFAEDPQRTAELLGRLWAPTQPPERPVVAPLQRTVSRITLTELSDTPPADSPWPPAKFGGQPDWVQDPQWPTTPNGNPLVFHGQLPLSTQPPRMAYIFFDAEGESWDPLSDANAVVTQPGRPSHLPALPMRVGPALFEPADTSHLFRPPHLHRRLERFVTLTAEADPEAWPPPPRPDAHGDWNKIGGTPQYLQGEQEPPGDGWEFAFQYTAGWAAQDLGDVAECYGFVRDDGSAAILWQCH